MDEDKPEPPDRLSGPEALDLVRRLTADSDNIVVISHARMRMLKRGITRRQIELCVQKGTITEGPFMNRRGNWQVNLSRHAAGEEITCVVAIEWPNRIVVISTF